MLFGSWYILELITFWHRVYCAWPIGCGDDRQYQECWLKKLPLEEAIQAIGFSDPSEGMKGTGDPLHILITHLFI